MNSWPASILRLSVETAENATSAPARRASRASATSLSSSGLSMGGLPGLQGLGGFFQIGEGVAHAVNLLVILVALAGQQHHVAPLGASNQAGDGIATAMDELDGLGPGEAGTDVLDDARRVLGARIVVGDQHHVGQALGHLGHQRALAAVAIAAA